MFGSKIKHKARYENEAMVSKSIKDCPTFFPSNGWDLE